MRTRNLNVACIPNRREALQAMLAATGVIGAAPRAWPEELFSLPPVSPQIRVLFFNAHLLPAIAQSIAGRRGQDDYRTQAIAARLLSYDIVGLCEVFEALRRQEIIRIVEQNAGQPIFRVESPSPRGRHFICGGLLLLSRLPIEGEPHFITYSKASRVFSRGYRADGFAAKGAIHARLRVPEKQDLFVDCFLTHLESVSSRARAAQIRELADFIAKHSSQERPTLVMGDMNVAAALPTTAQPSATEYGLLTDSLRQNDEKLVDLWPSLHFGPGGTRDALAAENCDRIDYIFASPPWRTSGAVLEPTSIRVEPFLDKNVKEGSLSDHAGVACQLAIRRH